MGNNLDFHEWIELPGDFDTDWHEQLRTNWEDSETRLIKSGSLANRPSSAPDGAYYLVEDSGDKRLTRYDENASGWVDEIVNPDGHDISPSSVSTDDLNIASTGTLLSSGQEIVYAQPSLDGDISNTTSTSFTRLARGSGFLPFNQIPDGATLYGRQWARASMDTSSETGTLRPILWGGFASGSTATLSELDLTFDSTSTESKDTGWVEITSVSTGNNYIYAQTDGKVSGGTLQFSSRTLRPAPVFAWRIE